MWLACCSAVLALLTWEIGLRNIGGVFHDRFTQPDDIRGWSLRPGFSGWMNAENTIWVQINSDGMRDREHPLAPPPRTLRVAVLGDSYMQGVNVEPEAMFTTFLERHLNRCIGGGARVDVLNFGVSGGIRHRTRMAVLCASRRQIPAGHCRARRLHR
jgi:hypothetical protein